MSTLMFRLLTFLAAFLSWRGAQRLGAVLGALWFYGVRIRRKVVLGNLALALPDRTKRERYQIARAAYRHFGISALEFLRMGRMSRAELSGRVHLNNMISFERALARGRGVIVLTAHFGNFDLLACSQAARGVPIAIVSRNLKQNGPNRYWMAHRKQSGLKIFPDEGAALSILRWLKAGRVLGLTVDQRTPKKRGGIKARFMGVLAWTTTAPATLALASGAALIPVRLERRQDGDHDLIVGEMISIPDSARPTAIRQVTTKINGIVTEWVERMPEQWMWLHRRFVDTDSNHELES